MWKSKMLWRGVAFQWMVYLLKYIILTTTCQSFPLNGAVCGTDSLTYESVKELRSAQLLNPDLLMLHQGPCPEDVQQFLPDYAEFDGYEDDYNTQADLKTRFLATSPKNRHKNVNFVVMTNREDRPEGRTNDRLGRNVHWEHQNPYQTSYSNLGHRFTLQQPTRSRHQYTGLSQGSQVLSARSRMNLPNRLTNYHEMYHPQSFYHMRPTTPPSGFNSQAAYQAYDFGSEPTVDNNVNQKYVAGNDENTTQRKPSFLCSSSKYSDLGSQVNVECPPTNNGGFDSTMLVTTTEPNSQYPIYDFTTEENVIVDDTTQQNTEYPVVDVTTQQNTEYPVVDVTTQQNTEYPVLDVTTQQYTKYPIDDVTTEKNQEYPIYDFTTPTLEDNVWAVTTNSNLESNPGENTVINDDRTEPDINQAGPSDPLKPGSTNPGSGGGDNSNMGNDGQDFLQAEMDQNLNTSLKASIPIGGKPMDVVGNLQLKYSLNTAVDGNTIGGTAGGIYQGSAKGTYGDPNKEDFSAIWEAVFDGNVGASGAIKKKGKSKALRNIGGQLGNYVESPNYPTDLYSIQDEYDLMDNRVLSCNDENQWCNSEEDSDYKYLEKLVEQLRGNY